MRCECTAERQIMTQYYKPNAQGEMQVIKLGRAITAEVLQVVGNDKNFKKHRRWVMAGKIADLANDFFIALETANEIVVTYRKDAEERHKYQVLAAARLKVITKMLDLAIDVEGLDINRIDNLISKCNDELKLLSRWKSKDEKRFSNLLG